MQGSKISLSAAEMELFADAEMILTKNSILQKTALLLTEVQEAVRKEPVLNLHDLSPLPKISKGENYLGLPYLILDYPRISNGDALFFIRSLFWWGNFYSSTLQLSGSYAKQYRLKLEQGYDTLSSQPYFVGIHANPWVHHFGADNYKKISTLAKDGFADVLWKAPHIKIAAWWPLSDWDPAAANLMESWKLLMGLIS